MKVSACLLIQRKVDSYRDSLSRNNFLSASELTGRYRPEESTSKEEANTSAGSHSKTYCINLV